MKSSSDHKVYMTCTYVYFQSVSSQETECLWKCQNLKLRKIAMLDVIYTHTSCSFFQPHDDKRFKKGDVIVPIALPHNWNDKCNFQPPEDVMVVGSYGADTCIKPQPQVDLAILLPKVCLFKAVCTVWMKQRIFRVLRVLISVMPMPLILFARGALSELLAWERCEKSALFTEACFILNVFG